MSLQIEIPADRTARTDLRCILHATFRYRDFRPHQESIIRAILERRDVFAVMPTGGGKSLCYQLPAHRLTGTCLVISPLISLMKDQVDKGRAVGLRAECLNSSQSSEERQRAVAAVRSGCCDLLYAAPERFVLSSFRRILEGVPLSLFAIDEAHCISEWGHDFRPDYLHLANLVQDFPDVPVAAFTATATPRVQADIISRLGLRAPHIVRASFNRPNLYYEVADKTDADAQILAFLRRHPNQPGIVYRTTRKDVDATARFLQQAGFEALPYHAGMDREERRVHQDAFILGHCRVIVATIAFGMGIDKPDVRFVIHGDLPKSVSGYYQETGRAGRDGKPSHCLLLFDRQDIARHYYFIDQIDKPGEREAAVRRLDDILTFVHARGCRRQWLLCYFGEDKPDGCCRMCDACEPSRSATTARTAGPRRFTAPDRRSRLERPAWMRGRR